MRVRSVGAVAMLIVRVGRMWPYGQGRLRPGCLGHFARVAAGAARGARRPPRGARSAARRGAPAPPCAPRGGRGACRGAFSPGRGGGPPEDFYGGAYLG